MVRQFILTLTFLEKTIHSNPDILGGGGGGSGGLGTRVVRQFILSLTCLEMVGVEVVGRVTRWLDNSF